MKAELEHRDSLTAATYALLRERFGHWVPARDLAAIAFCSWRTRVSDARTFAERDDCEILWNKNPRSSAYMLRPKALGRDARHRVEQKSLFG